MESCTQDSRGNSVVKRRRMYKSEIIRIRKNRFITRLPKFGWNILRRLPLAALTQIFYPSIRTEENT